MVKAIDFSRDPVAVTTLTPPLDNEEYMVNSGFAPALVSKDGDFLALRRVDRTLEIRNLKDDTKTIVGLENMEFSAVDWTSEDYSLLISADLDFSEDALFKDFIVREPGTGRKIYKVQIAQELFTP